MKNIILEHEKHDPLLTGNKAANLARLKEAGFMVPSFITILPSAFCDAEAWQDPILEDELKIAHSLFNVGTTLLAVRSSAVDEDSSTSSFAGQLESFLNVSSEWVITAARSVWLSGATDRLKVYCKSIGIDNSRDTRGPAVIIQKMVDAKFAGVVFTADPVSGDRKTIVINAVSGLADRLVSGEVNGQLAYVHNCRGVKRTIAESENSLLTDSLILEIARTAAKIEALFGCPQDIEWAHDGTQLFILQARPITALPEQVMQGDLRIWDNSNIAESYQGVTTPLTFSFAAKAYEHVYIQFCRLMGVSDERISANQQIFPRMLGFVRGRIYYNLINWYRLLALLPGFQINRPFMEQMMGVKEELPAEIIEGVINDNKISAIRAYWNFSTSIFVMLFRFINLHREIAAFQNHFETTLTSVPKDLTRLSSDQLAKLYRRLEGDLLTSWDAPLVNDFFAMIFFGLLSSLSKKWLPAESSSHHELLLKSGGIISAEPARMITKMAHIAREDAELCDVLKNASYREIEKLLSKENSFAKEFRNYLQRFGDRCFNELKLESPTLNDNPLPLLRSIGAMASLPQKAEMKQEIGSARKEVSKLPLSKKLTFNFVTDQAIERIRWRENLRFDRTRLFGLVRRIFLELGKRFEQEDILRTSSDIFYLEVEEVLNFIEGKSTTINLAALAQLRSKESQQFKIEAAPPNRIVTRDAIVPPTGGSTPCVDRSESSNIAAASAPGHACESSITKPPALPGACGSPTESKGLGCSPGIVTGRVRVVRDPATAKPLEDEILIAERTDPGWIVLFTQAKGIIVEYGSLLSHTAIVSRELGIPAIVSAQGVMDWLCDGDLIEFDGKSGRITLLETAAEIAIQYSEHDPGVNVVKLIDSNSLRREAS